MGSRAQRGGTRASRPPAFTAWGASAIMGSQPSTAAVGKAGRAGGAQEIAVEVGGTGRRAELQVHVRDVIGAAALADQADLPPALYRLSLTHIDALQMAVGRPALEARVLDHHAVAATRGRV